MKSCTQIQFLKSNSKKLTIPILKNMFKINRIKGFSKLKKKELAEKMTELCSCKIIQRVYRKRNYNEMLCPILMDKVSYINGYVTFRPQIKGKSKIHYYDTHQISEYLVSSKDFRCPVTREDLTEQFIDSLLNNMKTKKYTKNINKIKRLWKRKNTQLNRLELIRERMRNNRDEEIRTLITMLEEMNGNVINILEGSRHRFVRQTHRASLCVYLEHDFFPEFQYHFNLLNILDREESRILLLNCRETLRGPERNPTRDPFQLIPFVDGFYYELSLLLQPTH